MMDRKRALPLRALIPNAITMLALCSGASAILFGIGGQFEKAAAAIVIAGVLDGIDGRVARLLRGSTRFGAELDSLSDVTAFGLAPALVLYLWSLHTLGRFGWVAALALVVGCALRLARFNAELDQENLPKKRLGFTTGVPAPAGAGMAMIPLFFALAGEGLTVDPAAIAPGVALWTVLTAFLMVSSFPGWGFRSVRIPRSARLFVLAAVGLFAAATAQSPWLMLFLLSLSYALLFPFAGLRYRRLRRREQAERGDGSAS